MKKIFQIIFTYLSLLLLLVFINSETPFPIFNTLKAILIILIAIFIPGYLFALLFLDKKTEKSEFLVISIAVSICFVILTGILIHLLGVSINAYNVLNILWLITSVFTIVLVLIKSESTRFRKRRVIKTDKTFYLNLVLIVVFFSLLIYLSMKFPSTEEFVELYWEFVKVENPTDEYDAVCKDASCSLSGINKFKKAKIDQVEYDILFLDLNEPEKYDSICIDLNQNDVYCEDEEGPFWSPEGFMINNTTFSYNLFGDGIVIFSFPKKLVNRTDFEVSYNIRSHYSKILEFDVTLTVNDEVFSEKEIILEPNQQMLIKDQVSIPEEERLHEVEVVVSPRKGGQSAKINFFVKYSTEY